MAREYDSYNERWGSGYAGNGRRSRPTSDPTRERGSLPGGKRGLQDMTEASLDRYIAKEVARRDDPVRRNEEAAQRSRDFGDAFELEHGRRPQFHLEQKGVVHAEDIFYHEQLAKQRAAEEAEHEAKIAERARVEAADGAELVARRAEISARVYQTPEAQRQLALVRGRRPWGE